MNNTISVWFWRCYLVVTQEPHGTVRGIGRCAARVGVLDDRACSVVGQLRAVGKGEQAGEGLLGECAGDVGETGGRKRGVALCWEVGDGDRQFVLVGSYLNAVQLARVGVGLQVLLQGEEEG